MRLGIDRNLWTEFIVSFRRPCSLPPGQSYTTLKPALSFSDQIGGYLIYGRVLPPPRDEGRTEKSSTSEGLHLSVSDTNPNPLFHFFYVVTGLRVDVKYDRPFYLSFWALSKVQAQGEDEDWCASVEEAVAVPSPRKGEQGRSRINHR